MTSIYDIKTKGIPVPESRLKRKMQTENDASSESIFLDIEGGLADHNDESLRTDKLRHKNSKRKHSHTHENINQAERQLTDELFGEVDQMLYNANVATQFEQKFGKEDDDYFDGIAGEFEEQDSGCGEDSLLQENPNDENDRKAAWVDDDDIGLDFRKTTKKIKKKRRELLIGHKKEYLEKLKDNFSQAFGDEPKWAALPKKGSKDQVEEELDFNQTTGIYLASKQEKGLVLPKKELQIKGAKDLNGTSYSEGSIISCCEFNPKFEVAFVAGSTKNSYGSATLFQVDGTHNHKVQSVKFSSFPVKCGKFLHDGRKFIVGSHLHAHFFIYDMDSGKQIRMPWNRRDNSQNRKYFKVSPCGRWLAFLGNQGNIDIYDGRTVSYIESFKVPGEVSSLAFSDDGNSLYTHGDLGKVHIFDMTRRVCIHSFYDSGCLSGTSIDISCRGTLACGSSSGIVNLYNTSKIMETSSPDPVKALGKLVTSVNQLQFNHSGELLASASGDKEEAFKLIHVNSATYFANFPASHHTLARVNSIAFSPGDGYLSIGNNRATAKLYRLHHFNKY